MVWRKAILLPSSRISLTFCVILSCPANVWVNDDKSTIIVLWIMVLTVLTYIQQPVLPFPSHLPWNNGFPVYPSHQPALSFTSVSVKYYFLCILSNLPILSPWFTSPVFQTAASHPKMSKFTVFDSLVQGLGRAFQDR